MTMFLIKIVLLDCFDMTAASHAYFATMFGYTRISAVPGTVVGVKFLMYFSVMQISGLLLALPFLFAFAFER